jgi:hypothetical protein
MPSTNALTVDLLIAEAKAFADVESTHDEPSLFGVTDGKAVGTYLEQKFALYVAQKYKYDIGNSGSGIDFPTLMVDIKVTSIKQPQSSCPFRDIRQKVYGLGYHLLVFVYQKTDREAERTSRLDIQHVVFVHRDRTADFQLTKAIAQIIENQGSEADLVALFNDRGLPGDEIALHKLAEEVLSNPPQAGYLTISNALQWRLNYSRVITQAGQVDGITKVR